MHFLKPQISWKKVLALYGIVFLFVYSVNFSIDVFLSYESYYNKDFLYYSRYNLPIVLVLSLFYIFIIIALNNIKSLKKILLRFAVLLLFSFVADIIQLVLFQILGSKSTIMESLINLIDNNFIYSNSILNFISLLFTEFTYSTFKKQSEEIYFERIMFENERYKYNQLKNQINPHFLFNSLNLISAMIYNPENEKGTIYMDKLADIYRYVLLNDEKNIIKLSLEIEFIHKYIDIIKIRIYEGLEVNIDLDDDTLKRNVLPMSLQLLIENVVKHNIADTDNPLYVNIFSDGEYVIVSNNINYKQGYISSMGIGLKNLNQRYKLISGKEIIVINENNCFTVKIPLI